MYVRSFIAANTFSCVRVFTVVVDTQLCKLRDATQDKSVRTIAVYISTHDDHCVSVQSAMYFCTARSILFAELLV